MHKYDSLFSPELRLTPCGLSSCWVFPQASLPIQTCPYMCSAGLLCHWEMSWRVSLISPDSRAIFFPKPVCSDLAFLHFFGHSLELLASEELGKVFIFLWDLGIILVEMRCVFVQATVWKMCLHAPCCELSFLGLSFVFWLHLCYVFISRAF